MFHVSVMFTRRTSTTGPSRRDAIVTKNSSLLADQSTFLEKRSKELSSKIKFYEFYNAPITKFWSHSVGTPTCRVRDGYVLY